MDWLGSGVYECGLVPVLKKFLTGFCPDIRGLSGAVLTYYGQPALRTEQFWYDADCQPGANGKGRGLDTCYSATYMSQTRDQQRFTISEVAADWHESVVLQRVMWPSIARANGQLDPRCS